MQKSIKFFRILVILLVLYGVLEVLYFGSLTGFLTRCPYTDRELVLPETIKNVSILLEKDMYVSKGYDPDICSPLLKNILNNLVGGGSPDHWRSLYVNGNPGVELMPKGEIFTLNTLIAVTKHGFSAIDSAGPLYYLLLTDQQGTVYKIHTTDLGSNESESFFSYSTVHGRKGYLSWELFNRLYSR